MSEISAKHLISTQNIVKPQKITKHSIHTPHLAIKFFEGDQELNLNEIDSEDREQISDEEPEQQLISEI